MKSYKSVIQFFEERIGEGTAWDLDYGKLNILVQRKSFVYKVVEWKQALLIWSNVSWDLYSPMKE